MGPAHPLRWVAEAWGGSVWRCLRWRDRGHSEGLRCGHRTCLDRVQVPSCRGAFPRPGGLRPQIYWAAARGTWRPAKNRALCAYRWPLPRQRRWAPSASNPFRALQWDCPWRVPPASVLGCVRCGGLAHVNPVTDTSAFSYHSSFDGRLGRCTGAASCGRRHRPFRVGGRYTRVPRVCACVCPSWLGRAGQPPERVLVSLTFSCGRSRCALYLLGPLHAGVALFAVVAVVLLLLLFSFPFMSPLLSLAFLVFGPGVPWALAFCCPPTPPPFFFPLPPLLFFFLSFFAPPLSLAFRVFRPGVLWALASCCPPASLPLLFFPFFFYFFFLPPPPFFFLACFSFVFRSFFSRFPPPFSFFRAVTVVRCGGGLCVLGCGVCWCVLLGRCAPAGGGLRLLCVVRCSLVVPVPCVLLPVVLRVCGGAVLAALPRAACGALLGCFVLWSCSAALEACCSPWVLWWGCPVSPGLVLLFRLVSVCVVLVSLVWCFAPLWGAVWFCPPPPPAPPPRAVRCFFFFWLCSLC